MGRPVHLHSVITIDDTRSDSIAIVMPAYREEANLGATVRDFLATAESLGVPHSIIVVNDGSSDRTGEIADQLAANYPGRVYAVHHEVNRGYGHAVSTGIRAALDRFGHRWLFLTDSDGQFRSDDLAMFLEEARRERADAVIGYRPQRADPLHRKINAYLWTRLSGLMLPVGVRDVDCAYKLIDRRLLQGVSLTGGGATISPEIISSLRMQGARIIERPVRHFPREHGEQTGANLRVIVRSLAGLMRLSVATARRRAPGRLARRLLRPKDPVLAITTIVAVAASVTVYAYYIGAHAALAYPDAVSHLLISRRVLFASTPGLAQLGSVWLPLPHLLSLPFIWVNSWYFSGFAESVVSMAAYVAGVRYAYLITASITDSKAAGLVAAVFFGANPNVLYMQCTGMSELLLIATIAASVYYLIRWSRSGQYMELAAAACAGLLASLTRYEGWVYCIEATAVVAYLAWRRPLDAPAPAIAESRIARRERNSLLARYRSMEAHVIYFSLIALSGIAAWIIWNAVIFSDPLYFQTGPFAKPSLWVSRSDPNIGHLTIAAKTYFFAVADNAGIPALALAAAGLIVFLIRTRLRPFAVPVLTLTVLAAFYVYALYSGQRPLDVLQVQGNLYNVRFGILMILPIAVFIGFLSGELALVKWRWLRTAGFGAAILAGIACTLLIVRGGILTYTEAENFRTSPIQQAETAVGTWLQSHYTGGKVLMESFGNETATYSSRLPLGNVIYEGSFHQWQPALANPVGTRIRWIFMRDIPGNIDEVYTALYGTAKLDDYRLVYNHAGERVYEFARQPPAGGPAGAPGNQAGAVMRHGRLVRPGAAQ
ncbi:MAG TPA: glycosyltransferase family 2 protein [Streptosporangiaceae bacterium]